MHSLAIKFFARALHCKREAPDSQSAACPRDLRILSETSLMTLRRTLGIGPVTLHESTQFPLWVSSYTAKLRRLVDFNRHGLDVILGILLYLNR
jgi:hypothetical protein